VPTRMTEGNRKENSGTTRTTGGERNGNGGTRIKGEKVKDNLLSRSDYEAMGIGHCRIPN
jgi:hypothetical protein